MRGRQSLLFVSGQVGSREDGSPAPDLEDEVRLAFENRFRFEIKVIAKLPADS